MIYFLKDTGNNAIKIGYSVDPGDRKPALQTGNSNPLVFIGFIPGDRNTEQYLHKLFDEYLVRTTTNKEWFSGGSEFRAAIDRIISDGGFVDLNGGIDDILSKIFEAIQTVESLQEKTRNVHHAFALCVRKLSEAMEAFKGVGTDRNPLIPLDLPRKEAS